MQTRWTRGTAGVIVAVLMALGPVHAAQAADPTGVVTLVHGVRGLVADVYLDGAPVLKVFEPERITDALTLPAGAHKVQVRPTGADAGSAPLLDATLNVAAGVRQSAVVHLDSGGKPALTVFADDAPTVPVGSARLLVRHTAQAPAVGVTVDGAAVGSSVANGTQGVQQLTAGTHLIAVTSGSAALLPPREVAFAEGTSTALYLVGSATSANLAWLVENLPSTATAPAAVRTGNSPLGETTQSSTTLLLWVAVIGAAFVAVGIGVTRRRGHEHAVAGGAAAGFAGLAIGVTSLAVVARSPLPGRSRPALADASAAPVFAKVAGPPYAKSPDAGAAKLVVAPGSRPASLDSVVRVRTARPVTVAVQPGDIVARVEPEGADRVTGEMEIPTDPKVVGWYEHGPVPGQEGSAVIAGHVAFDGARGSFAGLLDAAPGAVVLVTYDDSSVRAFRVTERRAYAKDDLPDEVFRRTGPATLRLITCGGAFDRITHSYADNVVVTAVPM